MEFEVGQAIVAGLVGTLVMTILMAVGGSMMGKSMDMPMMLGTMFLPKGPAARAAGMIMHFMFGAVFFVIYAALLDAFALEDAIVAWTALFGVVHGLIAGVALGPMGAMHPRAAEPALVMAGGAAAQERVAAPGFFAMKLGAMMGMALVVLHAVYGAVGGAIYSL